MTQRELTNHPPFGLVSRVQVTIRIYSKSLFRQNLNIHGYYRFDSAMRYLSLIEAIALYGLILMHLY